MNITVTRRSVSIGAALAALTVTTSLAAPRTSYPVRVTIADVQAEHPLLVQSDGLGDYEPGQIPQSSIELYKNGYTDWLFTTYVISARGKVTPSNRNVLFNLNEAVSPDNVPSPIGAEYLQAHLKVACTDVNVNMLRIPPGGTVVCPGGFRFLARDGRWFRLAMSPMNFSDVNPVHVTCVSADSTGCRTWSITPSSTVTTGDDPNPKNVVKLLRVDANGIVLEQLGNYYLSFAITLRR
jgi:hypothetical protein